jgi:hypothetical protein
MRGGGIGFVLVDAVGFALGVVAVRAAGRGGVFGRWLTADRTVFAFANGEGEGTSMRCK